MEEHAADAAMAECIVLLGGLQAIAVVIAAELSKPPAPAASSD